MPQCYTDKTPHPPIIALHTAASDPMGDASSDGREYTRSVAYSLIDRYFSSDLDGEQLVKHQTQSFNDFVALKLDCIVRGMNPIEVSEGYIAELKRFRSVLSVSFVEPTLALPVICEKDGCSKVMLPNDARLRNMTYSSALTVDALVEVRTWNDDVGEYVVNSKRISGVSLGRIPLMVRSRYCMLSKQGVPAPHDECRYDYGGYFIVNGNEKVVISQDRIAENRTFVFANTTKTSSCYSHTAEVRSVNHSKFMAPKTTLLKLSKKADQFGYCIRANVHHIRAEFPIFILFRALGVESDLDIVRFVVRDPDDPHFARIAESLAGCMDEAADVRTQAQACEFLAQFVQSSYNAPSAAANAASADAAAKSNAPNKSPGAPLAAAADGEDANEGEDATEGEDANEGEAEGAAPATVCGAPATVSGANAGCGANAASAPSQQQLNFLQNVLIKDVVPHVGHSFSRKALYLGYMVNKLVRCSLGLLPLDDRDSYVNKRLDTPGVLLANLFRQYYCKMVKEMRTSMQSLLRNDFRVSRVINAITKTYMLKVVKGAIIESGLKYALSTGNWGMKTTRMRQGIAQVLNRMTYVSTLSHLRRVNTAIEKTGKLVQPRKLHPTQWGMTCPSETPEGSSVGLVKNLALLANVSVYSPIAPVRAALVSLDVRFFDGDSRPEEVFAGRAALVMLNGDIVGAHTDPAHIFKGLKRMKRLGMLDVYTTVSWNIASNEIVLCTEGGRFCRPLLVVHRDEGAGAPCLSDDVWRPDATWQELVVSGAIEYLDAEESDGALIALDPASDLKRAPAPLYTHAEIHPSSILGVVAGSIPFSDHNQAPRNTYQSAMGKQAVGLFATTMRHRLDTMSLFLNYPQEPLVSTHTARLVNCNTLPCGINTMVAIACFTGFNQEDSVIMSQSAVDRGLFATTLYRTFREQNAKNHSTGEEEFFCRPSALTTRNMKPYNYGLLDESGFVPEGTSVGAGDVIIGKCMPQKQGGVIVNRDASISLKSNEHGVIDRNCFGDRFFTNTTGDGYTFAKVRVRTERTPTVGDKVSCYSPDHELLTSVGWVAVGRVGLEHEVASLVGDRLVYQRPKSVQSYDHQGIMIAAGGERVDLLVTPEHRMYVAPAGFRDDDSDSDSDSVPSAESGECVESGEETVESGELIDCPGERPGGFAFERAGEVPSGESRRFEKRAGVWTDFKEYDDGCVSIRLVGETVRFRVPPYGIDCPLKEWLKLFGVCVTARDIMGTRLSYEGKRSCIRSVLLPLLGCLGPNSRVSCFVSSCLQPGGGLPDWTWALDRNSCRSLLDGIIRGSKGCGSGTGGMRIGVRCRSMADSVQRLCLHAGLSCDIDYAASDEKMHELRIVFVDDAPCATFSVVSGYRGKVHCVTVPAGQGVVLVRRNGRAVWCGNSRHGQKGTIGMLYGEEDMPFTETGIVPSIIINPHAIPSRMTIGQLMEALESKVCAVAGRRRGDASPFNGRTVEDIASELEAMGLQRYGDEVMYNPRTGEQVPSRIFVCPTYYQRLKHMVADKIHSRAANGPVVLLTRQPAEGRARDGGLRLGEMEMECLWAHGAVGFLKERFMECSDNYRVFACKLCGMIAHANPESKLYYCKLCKNGTEFNELRIPYASKLLVQEVETMGVASRFVADE